MSNLFARSAARRWQWFCWCSVLRVAASTPCRSRTEQVKAAWSQVLNEYQRRSDLIPNLVQTVKGYAHQEQSVLTAVTEARASATRTTVNLPPDVLSNPQAFQQFEQAQSQLGGALSRLMVASERYPDLKSNENFMALQSQLGRYRKPDCRRAARLYRRRADLQHDLANRSQPLGRRDLLSRRESTPDIFHQRTGPTGPEGAVLSTLCGKAVRQ